MQLAVLETEFSPDRLLQQLTLAGWVAKVSSVDECRVVVVAEPSMIQGLSDSVATFVISDWLSGYISQRLLKEHPYLAEADREYVRLLASHAFRQPSTVSDLDLSVWQIRIRDLVSTVLSRSMSVNIRGVLRFRCNEFLKAIDYILTDMVEHFLADREYEEFVTMLRIMLETQPPTTQTLHLYCTNERVWMCDEAGSLVQGGEIAMAAEQVAEDGTVDPEDLAMSILIMRSPCNIVIHDLTYHAPWPSFAQTVERVFLERAVRCDACSTCERLRKSH